MRLHVEYELGKVNDLLQRYVQAGRKLPEVAIRKQTDEFGYFLFRELKVLMPEKGSLRAQGFALLRARVGVRVRPAVLQRLAGQFQIAPIGSAALFRRRGKGGFQAKGRYRASVKIGGKRLNLQALAVRAELNLRESARGFLAVSGRFPKLEGIEGGTAVSRYGAVLGQQVLKVDDTSAESRFVWGKDSLQGIQAATGLSKPKAEAAIASALAATAQNMREYIERKTAQGRSEAE